MHTPQPRPRPRAPFSPCTVFDGNQALSFSYKAAVDPIPVAGERREENCRLGGGEGNEEVVWARPLLSSQAPPSGEEGKKPQLPPSEEEEEKIPFNEGKVFVLFG